MHLKYNLYFFKILKSLKINFVYISATKHQVQVLHQYKLTNCREKNKTNQVLFKFKLLFQKHTL